MFFFEEDTKWTCFVDKGPNEMARCIWIELFFF